MLTMRERSDLKPELWARLSVIPPVVGRALLEAPPGSIVEIRPPWGCPPFKVFVKRDPMEHLELFQKAWNEAHVTFGELLLAAAADRSFADIAGGAAVEKELARTLGPIADPRPLQRIPDTLRELIERDGL